MNASNEKSVDNLKEQGNACVKDGKFEEAVLHYSYAIKLEPNNYSLYSNRSFAFLKLQQYSLAMEDALATIKLKHDWAKGYFRKGEIELATHQYGEALLSYNQALRLQPDDGYITECLRKATILLKNDKKADDQIPWVGAGIGLVKGVIIVLADLFATKNPTLNHPLLMVLLIMVSSVIGYVIGKLYRWYVKEKRKGLLQTTPSLDLSPDAASSDQDQNTTADTNEVTEKSPRYTKAQARQRFKKGKL